MPKIIAYYHSSSGSYRFEIVNEECSLYDKRRAVEISETDLQLIENAFAAYKVVQEKLKGLSYQVNKKESLIT